MRMYDGLLVIDADAHKMENPVVFFDYLDAPYRDRLASRTDRYGQPRLVVRDRDPRTGAELERDFLFLVGPSGAGKSTVVRLLIREEKPTKGKIFVDGIELGRMKRRKLPYYRRKVGLVFQDFKLLPNLTVYENVAFALRVLGEPDHRVQTRVADALDTVSLSGKEHTYPANLSGGEQQRIAIARALVHAPRFIIADEPTGNLDPATAWEIMQLFLRINARGAGEGRRSHGCVSPSPPWRRAR